ncbi:hypothetical protein J4216_02335 [Candidatus Woesearchaeota archaeon]|nr:hypothetical protein [Candidatus Woesearchaeota archaeon]
MRRPSTKGPQYIPLDQIIELGNLDAYKCQIEIKNKKLFVDEREISGFLLDGKNVIIKGQHFTTRELGTQIRQYRQFTALSPEHHIYFVEDDFNSISESEIRHLIGATDIGIKFEVTFTVPTYRVFIKVQKNHPLKYAIKGGLEAEEVIKNIAEKLSF